MRIEQQSRFRGNIVAFLVGISLLFPRCVGVVALQLTSTRRTGTTPSKQQTLARLAGG